MATARAERLDYLQTPPQQDGIQPVWYESLWGLEALEQATARFLGREKIPRGDGSAVIVVPGFFSNDQHTSPLRSELRSGNYDSRSSGIWFANLNPEAHEDGIIEEVDKAFADTGRKVHLIGHSLGGIMVRAVAARRSEKVKSVTTLGSPLHGEPEEIINPMVLKAAEWLIPILRDRSRLEKRKREIAESLRHKGVRATSIYTKRDGVVDWRACVDPDPGNENIEVVSTHIGLIFHRRVYGHIGEILKLPELGEITEYPIFSRPAA